ncbi:unnamed protein product [Arabis nemorensis]|uniref:Uncharacterized protein n=1 Tax=Arabis nemorensis TaxID=586526 RepID=A0A565C516_9BRAS|nr:unnamed protein product [Arabis nemorensis]
MLKKKFKREEKAPYHLDASRDYIVDMMPKLMEVDGSYVFVKEKEWILVEGVAKSLSLSH